MGKSSSKPPPAPDPVKTAAAQAAANKEALLTSAAINRVNEKTPSGSLSWELDPSHPSAREMARYEQDLAQWRKDVNKANKYNTGLSPSAERYWDYNQADGTGVWRQRPTTANRMEVPDRPEKPDLVEGWRKVTRLSPMGKRAHQAQEQMAVTLGKLGVGRSNMITKDPFSLPGASPEVQDTSEVEQRAYNRAMELMRPDLERQQGRMETTLSNRGIPIGGEAYNDVQGQFDRSRDDMTRGAAFDAMRMGQSEQSRLYGLERGAYEDTLQDALLERTQPMNELAGLLQGSPALNAPQFGPQAQYQMAPPDVMGAYGTQYAGQLNAYNADRQSDAAGLGGLYSLGGAVAGALPWGSWLGNVFK